MSKIYERLGDSYEDIKESCIGMLNRYKEKYVINENNELLK